MTFLYMLSGAFIACVISTVLAISTSLLEGRFSFSIFVSVAIMAGGIVGFIRGHIVKEKKEQARIDRELELDRIRYEKDEPAVISPVATQIHCEAKNFANDELPSKKVQV